MTDTFGSLRGALVDRLHRLDARASDVDVFLVCNTRSSAIPTSDFSGHSLRTECYSDQELSEVIGNLRRDGLNVANVFDEAAFARIALEWAPAADRTRILMNFGSARLGPWGKTLVPALADAAGWLTTNSNAYAVALARHKFHCAALLDGVGIRSVQTWCFSDSDGWLGRGRPPEGITVLMQPAFESASIGVDENSRCLANSSLDDACRSLAREFRQDVVVREFVSGYEVEVPVVRLDRCHALPPIGISIDGERQLNEHFLTYHHVFNDAYSFYPMEGELGSDLARDLQHTSQRVSEIIGLRGFSRVDYRVSSSGEAYVTDVSASPHFVSHSSFAEAAKQIQLEPRQLPSLLIAVTLQRRQML